MNLTQLFVERPPGDAPEEDLQGHLWKVHDRQPSVPPVWQRRRLPLQAATVISKAKDPLFTLQSIIQNLPSTASTLVHVDVDDAIAEAASIQKDNKSLQPGLLYLNGKVVAYLDRPSFNVFEVVDQIRKEQAMIDGMGRQFQDVPQPFVHSVLDAWMTSGSCPTTTTILLHLLHAFATLKSIAL